MSLVRAESRRLFKRRFVKVLIAGVLLVLAATLAGTYVSNEKLSEVQITQAKADAERDYQQAVAGAAKEKQDCLAGGTNFQGVDCESLYVPSQADYDYRWYMPATFNLKSDLPDLISVFVVVLAAAGFIIGASFVGAEWNSGGMMNLLLWRPQRLRVLGTKLGVLLGWLTAFSVLLGALWVGAFRLVAGARGTADGMTSGVWQSFGLMGLRGLALIVVFGAVGFALASLGRHTGMALGVLVGFIALQIGVYVMVSLAEVKYPDVWLAPLWVFAWLYKEFVVEDYNSCNYSSSNGCELDKFTMTWETAGIGIGALAIVAVGAAMWTMRKRDIT